MELTLITADRLLAEEIFITTAMWEIRKKTHLPNPVGFHWNNIPTLFLRLKYYCLDHKLKMITLSQIRFNLIHLAVACNYRDSVDPVDELFNHLTIVMRDNEIDPQTTMNIYRIVDGIMGYVRLPHTAG